MPTARPVAPLARELTVAAAGTALVAAGGLAAALATIDGPLRGVLLFVVSAAVVGATQAARAAWIGHAPAPAVADGAPVERRADTIRRHVVILVPAAVLVGVCVVVGGGLGALIAGVVAGTAAGDARALNVARRREGRDGAVLLRELGGHPFAGPRRPLYIRSRSESTLFT